MEEHQFRRVLSIFPVVRSRDYCADSGSSSSHHASAQEMAGNSRDETSDFEDPFMQNLRMAAEKKVGATDAELFCKLYKEAHGTSFVRRDLNLDAARTFANANKK